MFHIKSKSWIIFLLLMFVLSACGRSQATPEPTPTISPGEDVIALANPASVHCEEQGGTLELSTDASGGQYGVCLFPDGSECEEWAFFRSECQPGGEGAVSSLQAGSKYTNQEYGFSFDSSSVWAIEDYDNRVNFRNGDYYLFVGFKWADEQLEPFRSGMPAGDLVPDGKAILLDQEIEKTHLVFENKIKTVIYGSELPVGDLRLSIWLDVVSGPDSDYRAIDIPTEIIVQADQILASFTLIAP